MSGLSGSSLVAHLVVDSGLQSDLQSDSLSVPQLEFRSDPSDSSAF